MKRRMARRRRDDDDHEIVISLTENKGKKRQRRRIEWMALNVGERPSKWRMNLVYDSTARLVSQ